MAQPLKKVEEKMKTETQYSKVKDSNFYDEDFLKHKGTYSKGDYKRRNKILAKQICKCNPERVFEFAGSEGQLAEMVLSLKPNVIYDWTDFSKQALKLSQVHLSRFKNCRLKILDIDQNYGLVDWQQYDVVVSTSLEHLVNDRGIIGSIKPCTYVFLCLPNFDAPGHIRYFKTWKEIDDRYSDLLNIIWVRVYYEKPLMNYVKRFLDWIGILELLRKRLHIFKRGVVKKWLIHAIRKAE